MMETTGSVSFALLILLVFVTIFLFVAYFRGRAIRLKETTKISARRESPPETQTQSKNVRDIFISYRRDDSADIAGRLFDSLVSKFGSDRVYKDVDSTRLGFDFADQIETHLQTCRVALIVMGPDWVGTSQNDRRRIDDENDFVRLEVRQLLARDVPAIPVFVRGASMVDKAALPADIQKLVTRNGIKLRPDPDFHNDAGRLARAISEILDEA